MVSASSSPFVSRASRPRISFHIWTRISAHPPVGRDETLFRTAVERLFPPLGKVDATSRNRSESVVQTNGLDQLGNEVRREEERGGECENKLCLPARRLAEALVEAFREPSVLPAVVDKDPMKVGLLNPLALRRHLVEDGIVVPKDDYRDDLSGLHPTSGISPTTAGTGPRRPAGTLRSSGRPGGCGGRRPSRPTSLRRPDPDRWGAEPGHAPENPRTRRPPPTVLGRIRGARGRSGAPVVDGNDAGDLEGRVAEPSRVGRGRLTRRSERLTSCGQRSGGPPHRARARRASCGRGTRSRRPSRAAGVRVPPSRAFGTLRRASTARSLLET